MGLRGLQSLKKESHNSVEITNSFYKYILVGSDPLTLSKFYYLNQQYPDQVSLLSENIISEENLLFRGPSRLRGEETRRALEEIFPDIVQNEQSSEPKFFKDKQFRKFGGRSKPETLLPGEEFFTQNYIDIDFKKIFSYLNDESFIETVNLARLDYKIKNIEKIDGEYNWLLECENGQMINGEHLIWGDSPSIFLDLVEEKKSLGKELIQFCKDTTTPYSLFVKFVFDSPITDLTETIFLPLSLTHEWGHFIGEFKNSDETKKQSVEFISFVDQDNSTEDDISKKIHLLKKNLEKVFPKFSDVKAKEFITLSTKTSCSKIDKKALMELSEHLHYARLGCTESNEESDATSDGNFRDYETEEKSLFSKYFLQFTSSALFQN